MQSQFSFLLIKKEAVLASLNYGAVPWEIIVWAQQYEASLVLCFTSSYVVCVSATFTILLISY